LSILHAIILGAVQGLTEFIPVSSSGHLVALPYLLHWAYQGKSFDAALHLGTLAALLLYYRRDWVKIISSFCSHVFGKKPYEKDEAGEVSGRLFVPIIVACIPAAIVGAKWDSFFEEKLSRWDVVAVALVVFGLLMLAADRLGKKERSITRMSYTDYLAVGFAQILALVPGVSRSGITITASLFRGLNREAAARFSFLLSTPIVLGAGVFAARHINFHEIGHEAFACGLLSSAIVGYFAIDFLIKYLKTRSMTVFVIYRICLAAVLVAVFVHR